MKRVNLVLLLSCVLSGCDAMPQAAVIPLDPTTLDGDWQLTSAFGITCFTIRNGRIVMDDDGCLGAPNQINTPRPPTVTGQNVIWTVVVLLDGGDIVTMTLSVEPQPDGSLIGSQTLLGPNGLTAPVQVVMSRL